MRLKDKVIIVTGSANGIGFATAKKIAAEGGVAVICDLKLDEASNARDEIIAAVGQAEAFEVNVTQRESIDNMVAKLVADYGRIDGLINNAGITQDARLIKMTEAQFDAVCSQPERCVQLHSGGGRGDVATGQWIHSEHLEHHRCVR